MSITITEEQFLTKSKDKYGISKDDAIEFFGECLPMLGDIRRFKSTGMERFNLAEFSFHTAVHMIFLAIEEEPELLSQSGVITFSGYGLSDFDTGREIRAIEVCVNGQSTLSIDIVKDTRLGNRVKVVSKGYCHVKSRPDERTVRYDYFKLPDNDSTKTLTDIADF